MKRIFLILILLFSKTCWAQTRQGKDDIRFKINYAITKNINNDLIFKTPEGKVYLFSVALSFDEHGHVDTIYLSKNLNAGDAKVIGLNHELLKKIKSLKLDYKEYSSKLVISPFLWYNFYDKNLALDKVFLTSFENIFPDMNKIRPDKKIVILDPFYNSFSKPIP
jgi:hypothetical protein